MFDPDNFYEILRCAYSWPRTNNVIMRFREHGSKSIKDLYEYVGGPEEKIYQHQLNYGDRTTQGRIILHDQEPFFLDFALTYREGWYTPKHYEEYHKIGDIVGIPEIFNSYLKSGLRPILCHSERNSPDIESAINDCLVIDCYYFYHGMIARDWFRHWQHHPDLLVRDRSDSKYRFMMYARGLEGTREYRKDFLGLMTPHAKQILHNWSRENMVSSDYSAKIDIDDANQSAIHIVLETLFDTPKIHLTEKVFKPMVMSQPFFLLAGPGSLGYLHDYGFQTFGEFWDESYDDIQDGKERMNKVSQEISKILALSDNEFRNLYTKMMPVIKHNRDHFFSERFQEICIKEMHDNYARAFDLQKESISVYPGGTWAWTMSRVIERGAPLSIFWKTITKEMLNSQYLLVQPEEILKCYPVLSRNLD